MTLSQNNKDYKIKDLDLPKNSQGSMLLWVLAKNLIFIGSNDLSQIIVQKANMRKHAATARPVNPKELLTSYGLEQIEKEVKTKIDFHTMLSKISTKEDLDNFLQMFVKEQVMLRDVYQCFFCFKPLSLNGASFHHIFWDKDVVEDVLSNLITLCFECHKTVSCKAKC